MVIRLCVCFNSTLRSQDNLPTLRVKRPSCVRYPPLRDNYLCFCYLLTPGEGQSVRGECSSRETSPGHSIALVKVPLRFMWRFGQVANTPPPAGQARWLAKVIQKPRAPKLTLEDVVEIHKVRTRNVEPCGAGGVKAPKNKASNTLGYVGWAGGKRKRKRLEPKNGHGGPDWFAAFAYASVPPFVHMTTSPRCV